MRPHELEVLRHAFSLVPEEMGIALRRTAHSPNIKERMDASCAVFDPEGEMLAQAEHIPVHLGAMPVAVREILARFEDDLAEGDQVILNDPYAGGTHLPDITLLRPVFDGLRPVGYAVNRAHHADVGGTAPGSMPADSEVLEQEGVVIPPRRFLRRGREVAEVVAVVRDGMRNPRERLGDLRAQVAANNLGAARLRDLVHRYGRRRLRDYAGALLDYSERRVLAAMTGMVSTSGSAEDVLEFPQGRRTRIRASVRLAPRRWTIDFAGTDAQVRGNLNAPFAVTLSASYYVARCLTDPEAPANAGAYRPVCVSAPSESLVNARSPAAVAAGNVETAQRIVDVLFLALSRALPDRVPAQSQGTMNNLLLGSTSFAYYETIAGGEGALPFRSGMSGVHTHMTNTRNTPVEALELAYPFRVEEYRLRARTGGRGRHRGGDGVRRAIRVLEGGVTMSLLSDRREVGPRGLRGGGAGRRGRNTLIRGRRRSSLSSKVTMRLRSGDVVIVETPGGGGWGRP